MSAKSPIAEPNEPEADASVTEAPRRRVEIDHDDLIGFASPASLAGRLREPAPPVEPEPEPELDFDAEPSFEPLAEPPPARIREPLVAAPAPVMTPVMTPVPDIVVPRPVVASTPDVLPAWARETPLSEQPAGSFARRREQPQPIEGASSLYTVYALILFAVPTFGVSALIALLAVIGRSAPAGEIAASHFIYQQRTLWIGAVVALLGGILIAVGLGVFVLFLLAVWLIVRGAAGVVALKASRPIARPRAWLV